MTQECEYQADERPALELTKKGHEAAKKHRRIRGFVLTEAALTEMNQPLPMDQYPAITMGDKNERSA